MNTAQTRLSRNSSRSEDNLPGASKDNLPGASKVNLPGASKVMLCQTRSTTTCASPDIPPSRQLRRCPGNHCLDVWQEDARRPAAAPKTSEGTKESQGEGGDTRNTEA